MLETIEKYILEIKVPINKDSVEQYTPQLTKDIIRLEGPYDES